jgi:tetratricopeptide (TPR) repeat protein
MALPDYLRYLKKRQLDPEHAGIAVAKLGEHASRYPEHAKATPTQRRHLERALEVVRACKAMMAEESALTLSVEAMLLGKLGRFDEAVDLTRTAHEAAPTWQSACAVGTAYLRAGRKPEAVDLFTAASRLDPRDVAALLQIGDIHLENDDWAAALSAYEEALRREEGHAWAVPSLLYCRYRLAGDETSLRGLERVARAHKDGCGVEGILETLIGTYYSSETGRRRATYLLNKIRASRSRKRSTRR